MATEIRINYTPRNWAKEMHASFKRWLAIVIHRRGGKTTSILHHHQRAALDNAWDTKRLRFLNPAFTDQDIKNLLKRRVYWHGMPTGRQGKLTGAWDTLKEISAPIPGVYTNETEMLVRYPNGNKVQIVGLEDPDAKRGPALSGLSLDEYSQIPANAFGEVLSKSLADHLGYCIWAGTIKGEDHLYNTYEVAKGDPDWFSLWQNIDQSLATESGATISALRRAMEDDRKLVLQGLMTEAEFQQEWYLSHEAAIKGSFYAEYLAAARREGRVCNVPYDTMLPVDTDWDLGNDGMIIWFSQSLRSGEVRLIDYYEDMTGGGFEAAFKALRGLTPNPNNDPHITQANSRRGRYNYGEHWGPHDIEVRELFQAGKTRREIARANGVNFKVVPNIPLADGIVATQFFFSKCWFDEQNCKGGLSALLHYRRAYNQRLAVFTGDPVHDGASHGADAFRMLSVRHKTPVEKKVLLVPQPRRHQPHSYMGG